MTDIIRYGVQGGPALMARAVQADGWLYVSGQVPRRDGQIVAGNVTEQTHVVIGNLMAILAEAGYGPEHVVRCGVWLDDARDFAAFNVVYQQYFGEHPLARACVESRMMTDCKVEVDCVAYKRPAG